MIRRNTKEVKRLTGEMPPLYGTTLVKPRSFLRTVRETFDNGVVAEGLATRALDYLLGREAQDSYTLAVTTGTNPQAGVRQPHSCGRM